jgi:protein-tyrosine-phosphatase
MKSVLFVCTANMCRSPLAEGLFLKKLGEEKDGWRVESAGTWAAEGTPASQKSLQVLRERGVDLSYHRAKVVNRELIREFALILVMEEGQKEALRVEFPEYKDRVYLLSEMIGEHYEIDDPVGRDLEDYQMTADEIEVILDKGFETISRLAEGKDD